MHKCILILVLAFSIHFLWIGWKFYILKTPELWSLVDISLVQTQIIVNAVSIFLLGFLIIFSLCFQHKKWAEKILPHFIITIFIILFIRDGYLIGIYSPATIVGFICISGIGLILFNRATVYFPLFLAIITFLFLSYNTSFGDFKYAPLFSSKITESVLYQNNFWVLSMFFFIVPILVACFILCEVLLSQWRHRENLIRELSQTDPLTNLYNRRYFSEKLKNIHSQQISYAIILIDLDHFKNINDLYGHHAGDNALKQIAMILSSHLREQDFVARYGGEEFIIALPENNLKLVRDFAEKCRVKIQAIELEAKNHQIFKLTASFGIAFSNPKLEIEQVIHAADLAMYRSKQLGRNQIQIYDANYNLESFLQPRS